MMNVGSLSSTGQSVFDYETQAGITHLLASVRASELSSAQKNDLRDLVFLYSNGGKDKRVLVSLEQKISEYNLQAVPKKIVSSQASAEQPTIGKFRSAPTFGASHNAADVPPTPPKKVDFSEDKTWQREIKVTTEPEIVPAQSNPTPLPTAVPETPEPTLEAPSVPSEPVAAPDKSAPSPDNQQQALERIREIKTLVNEKVGNPVNLVDIDNTVGREYMGALLDAMKKLNTGSSAVSAMARLEKAFVAVEETLKNRTQNPAPKEAVVEPSPEPVKIEVASEPATVPTPIESQAPDVVLEPVVITAPEPLVSEVVPDVPQPEEIVPDVPQPEGNVPARSSRLQIKDIDSSVKIASTPVAINSSIKEVEPHIVESTSGWDSVESSNVEPKPVSASGIKPLASLADLSQPTQSSAPKEPEVQKMPGDSLHTSEIDNGLEQLLGEWQIFKKSGIFGTGPSGREHPLFKKMAPLQIPLLLAGRFEGATQEIKQSVTDYMNGWRYEQGLIYEQGEVFEHYLRRVIKHILDLQKSKL